MLKIFVLISQLQKIPERPRKCSNKRGKSPPVTKFCQGTFLFLFYVFVSSHCAEDYANLVAVLIWKTVILTLQQNMGRASKHQLEAVQTFHRIISCWHFSKVSIWCNQNHNILLQYSHIFLQLSSELILWWRL